MLPLQTLTHQNKETCYKNVHSVPVGAVLIEVFGTRDARDNGGTLQVTWLVVLGRSFFRRESDKQMAHALAKNI